MQESDQQINAPRHLEKPRFELDQVLFQEQQTVLVCISVLQLLPDPFPPSFLHYKVNCSIMIEVNS